MRSGCTPRPVTRRSHTAASCLARPLVLNKQRQLAGKITMGRTPDGDTRQPGVYAHHYFGHADGAWLILYAWLRLEARLPACAAYEEAVKRATGAGKSVDVSDLLPEEVA